jgi:hypothetical protein
MVNDVTEEMKVFIFGAGASRGSQNPAVGMGPGRNAPLVDQLFDPEYLALANVNISLLSDDDVQSARAGIKAAGSLEKWLTESWEKIGSLRQAATKSAQRALFGRITLYVWNLLREVSKTYDNSNGYYLFAKGLKAQDEAFGLISFNYDTLLDRALKEAFGVPMMTLEHYQAISYIKPHGSVNWLLAKRPSDPPFRSTKIFPIQPRLAAAAYSIFNGSQLDGRSIRVMQPNDPELDSPIDILIDAQFDQQYFYPLIFMPLRVKQYQAISGFYEILQSQWTDWLSRASEVFLIGYRAEDDIIKEMLSKVKRRALLNVVSIDDAEEIAERVLKQHPRELQRGTVSAEGFYKFAENYKAQDQTNGSEATGKEAL